VKHFDPQQRLNPGCLLDDTQPRIEKES